MEINQLIVISDYDIIIQGGYKMVIQKCGNCGRQFKYKDLFKSFWPKNSIDCKNCGTSHEVTILSSFFISALIIIPSFSISNLIPNILLRLLIISTWIMILMALHPFIVRYKLKDRDNKKF